ncbi:hypothetical protein F2P79_003022 [Pimephales promelas]|nr:hypothetical protein F2P79_003022 [Pimephales promelas]
MGKKVNGTWLLLLLLLITATFCTRLQFDGTTLAEGNEQTLREYGRDWLLSLRRKVTPEPGLLDHVPEELLRQHGGNRPRKRGRRGGIKLRLRRRATRPPLPSILFGNVRSLRNKMEELRLNTKACNEYRESCLMIYTETWLQEDFPDSLVQQYVKDNTRKNRTLDKCYGNIKDAYAARIKPPLSNSDHNIIHLIPTFKCAIKKSRPISKTVSVWQDETNETLSGCFLATDWDVFYQDNDIDRIAETITGYIQFCVDTVVPKKTITIYPNNKDYITPEIKQLIRRKKQAFRNNDLMELRSIQKDLRGKLKKAREEHSKQVREAFLRNNPKKMWDTVKEMTNMNSGQKELSVENEFDKANDLNIFYKRFDLNED